MRFLLVFPIVMIAACQSYFDDQQARVDRQNAQRDHEWCIDIGVDRDDGRYPDCRMAARMIREDGMNEAKALTAVGLLGVAVSE